MIKIRRNYKEIEGRSFGAIKSVKQGKNRGLRDFFRGIKEASTKSPLCCEIISQPQAPLCDNFRSCEVPSWHTSTISQHSSPHFAAAKWATKMSFCCENDLLLRNQPSSAKIKTTLDIPLFFIKTSYLSCQKVSERKNTKATFCSLSHLSPKPRKPPAITFGHFLQSAMA